MNVKSVPFDFCFKLNFQILILLLTCLTAISSYAQFNSLPASGNVGIGLTGGCGINTGQFLLHVVPSNVNQAMVFGGTNCTPHNRIQIGIMNSLNGTGMAYIDATGNTFSSNNNNSSLLLNRTTGNVGIGIDYTPTQKLEIGGNLAVLDIISPRYNSVQGFINVNKLQLNAFDNNTDPISIERVNYSPNKTETRISISDDLGTADDFLSFGVYSAAHSLAWKNFASLNTLGEFRAKKFIATQLGWADYVFNKEHQLLSLEETEAFIENNKHLPGIPSEKEIVEKGLDTGEMLKLQMAKIEELTLHLIAQQKKIEALEKMLSK